MKRLRCNSVEAEGWLEQDLRGTHDTIAQEDFLGAAALLGLSSGGAGAHTPCYAQQAEAEPLVLLPSSKPESSAAKGGRHVSKASRTSYSTRSYVWRGPHRGALALRKKQLQQLQQHQEVPDLMHPSPSEGNSSRRSSASGAAPSDDDEVAQQQQQQEEEVVAEGPYASARQRDKEWAALTTWLRMNLHHPRTAKKLVLFVGEQKQDTGSWTFMLNPGLTWGDVSIETKLRLKTLPVEAEQAFLHKYPDRPAQEWGSKVQKYKPVGGSSTVNVCLKDMVTSLSSIYFEYEPHERPAAHSDPEPAEQPQEATQLQGQPEQVAAALRETVRTEEPEAEEPDQRQEQQQQHERLQAPALGVPVGYMPSAMAAYASGPPACSWLSAYAHWPPHWPQQLQMLPASTAAAAAAPAQGVPAMGVPADVAAAASAAASIAAAGAASCRQVQAQVGHPLPAGLNQLWQLPAVALMTGDGTDSCNESVTPVAARTSVAFAAAC